MQPTYISVAETAKLIRPILRARFPGVAFAVTSKSYSMGASISIRWTDGPTAKLVEAATACFAGGRFDGSVDLRSSVSHWLLPDGTVSLAEDAGTVGSGGERPASKAAAPGPGAKLVRFGSDYVHCTRSLSPAFERKVLERLGRRGFNVAGIESFADAANVRAYPDQDWQRDSLASLAREEASRFAVARGVARERRG